MSNTNTQTTSTETTTEITDVLKALESGAKLADVIAKVNEIVDILNNKRPTRNRGPESTREMTKEDAERIMLGDLKDKKHNECATLLGLSYGQVYSARGGYTFKEVYKKASELKKVK